jgi:ribosomal protein S18 acetylase RimI-like enzyme
MECKITAGEANIAYQLALAIPEFTDSLPRAKFNDRIRQTDAVILVVYVDDQPVGFKIGYQRTEGAFYSWLGAVLPSHRNLGLAKDLAFRMEAHARLLGYRKIWMKTRNRFTAMLHFAIRNGFLITAVEKAESADQNKIILEKKL